MPARRGGVIRLPRVALLIDGVEPAGGLVYLAPPPYRHLVVRERDGEAFLCAGEREALEALGWDAGGGDIVVAAWGAWPNRFASFLEALEYWSERA
jgi:hypothetical protein